MTTRLTAGMEWAGRRNVAEGSARRIPYLSCFQKCDAHLDTQAEAVPGAAAGRPRRACADIPSIVLVTRRDCHPGGALRGGQPEEPQEVRQAREMRGRQRRPLIRRENHR